MDFKLLKKKKSLDFIGIGVSFACIIHCLFSLAFIMVAAIWHLDYVETESHTHEFMLASAILIGAFTFIKDFQKHRNISVLANGLVGIGLLASGVLVDYAQWIDATVTLTGCLFIIHAHWLNYKKLGHYCNIKHAAA